MSLRRIVVLVLCLTVFQSQAVIILKIKNQRCLIDLEGASHQIGDHFEAIDLYGKARGIVQIQKIKGNRAIGQIIDGRAGNNWILEQTSRTTLEKPRSQQVPTVPIVQSSPKNQSVSHYISLLPSLNFSFLSKNTSQNVNQDVSRFTGVGGGTLIFGDFYFLPFLSGSIGIGAQYIQLQEVRSERQRNSSCSKGTSKCNTWMVQVPQLRLGLNFTSTPILNKKVNFSLGIGGGISYWGPNDGQYYVLQDSNYGRLHSSAYLTIGVNFLIPQYNIRIPVMFDNRILQPHVLLFSRLSKDSVFLYTGSLMTGVSFAF